MRNKSILLTTLLPVLMPVLTLTPAWAQSVQYDPSSFSPFTESSGQITSQVYTPNLIQAQTRNGLAPTTLDSFVYSAGGSAELIYGDEGTDGLPPYYGFDKSHRINAGIQGTSAAGLTTGHGSYLPDAWGGDEFTGNEWDKSGGASPTALAIQALLNMLGFSGLTSSSGNFSGNSLQDFQNLGL